MLFNNKDLSKRVLERCKTQQPLKFRYVTSKDIERLLDYYSYTMSLIIKAGGFLTLSIYKTHLWNRCIRIAPIQRNVVYKEYKKFIIRRNYKIKKIMAQSSLS
jgi:hypothetical protein